MKRALTSALLVYVALYSLDSVACAQRFLNSDDYPTEDVILHALLKDKPLRFTSVGHTSIVLKVDLAGTIDAAFKPYTRSHFHGYRGEVAAYRIAKSLGLDNVPPADIRKLGGKNGAMIYWISHLQSMDIKPWPRWLNQNNTLQEFQVTLARDVSNMLVFDYLIANWDRFSGGNINTDRHKTRLIVRDHNLAFNSPLQEDRRKRIYDKLIRVQRFSASLYESLQKLSTLNLSKPGEESILSTRQADDVLKRKSEILQHIDSMIKKYGREKVLGFK